MTVHVTPTTPVEPATPVEPVKPVTPVEPATPAAPSPVTPDAKGDKQFSIPEAYAKEPWAQSIKSPEDLWSQFANAQTVIGKKGVIIPSDKATPEEVKNFHKALGVPETPEGYEFQTIEELKDQPRDATVDNRVKQVLLKYGVPKTQGEKIIHELEQMVFETAKPRLEAATKAEKEFAALRLATFGDKAETAMAQFEDVVASTLAEKYPQLVPQIKALSPEARTAVMAFGKVIHDTYVGESRIATPRSGAAPASADLLTQYQEISDAKVKVRSDANIPAHIKSQKLAELNKQLADVGKKARDAGIDLFAGAFTKKLTQK